MSKSFARLADFLLNSYTEASFMTASELAHALNLDAATVVRFSQRLGYTGFPQLQREIRSKVKNDLLIRPRQAEDDHPSRALPPPPCASSPELEQTRITLDTVALDSLVEQIGQFAPHPYPCRTACPARRLQTWSYCLEQGGFLVYIARPGLLDLARTAQHRHPRRPAAGDGRPGRDPLHRQRPGSSSGERHPHRRHRRRRLAPSTRAARLVLAAHAHLSASARGVLVEAMVLRPGPALRCDFARPLHRCGTGHCRASQPTRQRPLNCHR